MDVRCTRCGTEYEFDDALISERGTSVRCTQCSYQFRVFPPAAKSVGPDEWVVLTNLGRRVVYRTLRELQNGIARGEVAREDLLARGTAPPRPLGSIAELDPLFATKAAPDKKSSTLTGVAPPADGSRKRAAADDGSTAASAPTEETGALRAPHDTWSGVAPQAKITDLAELAARPSPPMRVSGSRTVLGIGSPQASATREPAPPVRAPAQSEDGRADLALKSAADGNSPGHLSVNPSSNFEEAPQTRSFESDAPVPPEETRPLVGEGHTVPLAIVEGQSAPHQPGDSEPPTLPPPPSGLKHQRIGTSLGLGTAVQPGSSETATAQSVAADSTAVVTKPLPFGTGAEPVATARAGIAVEPPVRGASDIAATAGSEEPAKLAAGDAGQDSLEPRTLISESALQRPAPEPAPARRIGSAPRNARPVAAEVSRPDAVTRPPSRPQHPRPAEKPANRMPAGIVFFAVVLLGGAGWVGMKLTSLKLDAPQTKGAPSAASVPTAKPDSMTLGVESAKPVEAPSPLTPIDEALEAGDSEAALGLLEGLDANLQTSTDVVARRAIAQSNSIDLLYWQLRLTPAVQTSATAELQQTLQKRLTALAQLLDDCRKGDDCKLRTQAAFWALCRMQHQPERAQPPKQGTVDANGLYQLAMLDWSQVKTPDKKTLDRLTKARLTGVVQGPRVTALIVALVDSGRTAEAKAELDQLGTQAKAHPHLELLNNYWRAAAQVPDAGVPADASSGASSGETADMDAALREPDFRVRLQRAVQSLSRGEVTKATKLFRSVLAERPNDTEAITGMGDIHRRRSDFTQARTFYDRALALNGNYLPAMVGAADVRWQTGDRAAAVGFYRRIVERVGDGPGYGQTASGRIREFESGKEPEKPKAPADGKPKDDSNQPPAAPGNPP